MVVLLVIAMYLAFILIDVLMERHHRQQRALETEARHAHLVEKEPQFVAGYVLPEDFQYHRGHTWLHWVSPDEAYVGVDDFGRRLIGADATVIPPNRGSWVRQGMHAAKIRRDGRTVDLLSPVSGEVVGVNPELRKDPALINHDAYGNGWLYKIKASDLHQQIANLLSGSLAKRWMEDTRDRFQRELMATTGSVIQDGGTPVDDIAAQLEPDQWEHLAEEFFELKNDSQNG